MRSPRQRSAPPHSNPIDRAADVVFEGLFLGRLEDVEKRWIARLPPPPRPVWAVAVEWVLKLVLGRFGWLAGAAVLALAAPLVAGLYREAESWARVVWLANQATARAEATVERAGFRVTVERSVLAEDAYSYTEAARAAPFVVLRFTPAGEPPVLVRYWPAGSTLRPPQLGRLGPELLTRPPDLAPGRPWSWTDERGELAAEIHFRRGDGDVLARPRQREETTTAAEELLQEIDRPFEILAREWQVLSQAGTTVPVRYDPDRPDRAYVAGGLEDFQPLGDRIGRGMMLAFLAAAGLLLGRTGVRLLTYGHPPWAKRTAAAVPLLLLPWWGPHYPALVGRLSHTAGRAAWVVADTLAFYRSAPESERFHPDEAQQDDVYRWSLTSSAMAPWLTFFDLGVPADSGDPVPVLSARLAAGCERMPDEPLGRLLSVLGGEVWADGGPRFAPAFGRALEEIAVAPARPELLRERAWNVRGQLAERGLLPALAAPDLQPAVSGTALP